MQHSTSVSQQAEPQSPGYERRWWALLFIGISLIVISLDNTILNVAIPSISRTLNASQGELQWIVDAYILVFAALLLTMGALGDRYGRKRALQAGLVLFGIGSLAAALAPTTTALIAARGFLGIGGATIMPATLSIITATFPDRERPQAIAIWAAIFALGVGIGPVLGGWLLEHFEWNAVFLVNLPVVAIALVGGAVFVAESRDPDAPKTDIPGVVLSIAGLFSLVYGIIEAGQFGWTHDSVLVAFGAAAVFLGAFAWWEHDNPNAMLPMYFFKNMSFTAANTALALVTFSLMGSMFFMSQYFQSVQGISTFEAGLRVFPLAAVLTFTAANSARVAARLGIKLTVALGIVVAGLGLLYMSQVFHVETPYWQILIGQIIFAVGMGSAMSPATNSIMASVPVSKAGIGSAMNDTTRQLGGALGVAVLGSVFNQVYVNGVDTLRTSIRVPPAFQAQAEQAFEAISGSIQAAHIVALRIAEAPLAPDGIAERITTTANLAFVEGMNHAMLIGAVIMILTGLATYIVLPSVVRRSEAPEQRRPASERAAAPSAGD